MFFIFRVFVDFVYQNTVLHHSSVDILNIRTKKPHGALVNVKIQLPVDPKNDRNILREHERITNRANNEPNE